MLEERRLLTLYPVVSSIVRATPVGQFTTATTVDYTVNFSTAVTGVAASDFQVVTGDGDVQAQSPVIVTGSGQTYTEEIDGIHGSSGLQLELVDNGTIYNPLESAYLGTTGVGNGSYVGPVYTFDHTDPVVLSINRTNPAGALMNARFVIYTVTPRPSPTRTSPAARPRSCFPPRPAPPSSHRLRVRHRITPPTTGSCTGW